MAQTKPKTTRLLGSIDPLQFIPRINEYGSGTNVKNQLDPFAQMQIGLPSVLPAQDTRVASGGASVSPSYAPYITDTLPIQQDTTNQYLVQGASPRPMGLMDPTNQPPVMGQEDGVDPTRPVTTRATYDNDAFRGIISDLGNASLQVNGINPEFSGSDPRQYMRNFMLPPTPVVAPQQMYDPQRAMDIMRVASFAPLAGLLGGSMSFGQRLAPDLANQAIRGDMANWQNKQDINQKFAQSMVNARIKDSENMNDMFGNSIKMMEDSTERSIATGKAREAGEKLKLDLLTLKNNVVAGVLSAAEAQAKTTLAYQEYIASLDPQSQINYVSNLDPVFKQKYGIGLPIDPITGQPIPLVKSNPNEPSPMMQKMSLLREEMDSVARNLPYMTLPGLQAAYGRINELRLAINPNMPIELLDKNVPVTPISAQQQVTNALNDLKYRLDVAQFNANNKFRQQEIGISSYLASAKVKQILNQIENSNVFGAAPKMYAANLNRVNDQIIKVNGQINNLLSGRDIMGVPLPQSKMKNNQPRVEDLQQQLGGLIKQRDAFQKLLMTAVPAYAAAMGGGIQGGMYPSAEPDEPSNPAPSGGASTGSRNNDPDEFNSPQALRDLGNIARGVK